MACQCRGIFLVFSPSYENILWYISETGPSGILSRLPLSFWRAGKPMITCRPIACSRHADSRRWNRTFATSSSLTGGVELLDRVVSAESLPVACGHFRCVHVDQCVLAERSRAETIANISFSIWAYRFSKSVKSQLAYPMGLSFWGIATPRPLWLASLRMVRPCKGS